MLEERVRRTTRAEGARRRVAHPFRTVSSWGSLTSSSTRVREARMFVTMVEASVVAERESDLLAAWAAETGAGERPAGLLESSLLRSESGTWRIVTVWESRDAVMAMRAAGRPAAVVMLEAAGGEPAVTFWTVEGRLPVA